MKALFHSVRCCKKHLLFSLAAILVSFSLQAAIENAANRISGSSVVTASTVTAVDNKYNYMQANSGTWYNVFKVASGKGRVKIGMDHSSFVYVATAYDYNFLLKIEYQDTSLAAATTIYRTVRAAYDPSASSAYQDAGLYEVNNAKVVWIKVTIDSILNNLTSGYVSAVPLNMFVEASTEVDRHYVIDYTTVPSAGSLFYTIPATTAITDSNEVRLGWNYLDGAEAYDVEWTYVNDFGTNYSTNPNDTLALTALHYDFSHNSTRITTSDQHYTIPLLFDRGYLLFRIRAVGRAYDNTSGEWKTVFGKWTSDGVGSISRVDSFPSAHRYHIYQPHEINKNWQYSGTFAEEGKKKEVISYYDGSLRNRQTVTKTSTDKKVLVGETFYDFQGRAAISALPAPVLGITDAMIRYYDGFNRVDSSSGKTYSRYDFDMDSSACVSSTLAMSTNSGASKYYSPANTEITFQQAWLPDAKKYPFAQVEYMPDNTGRIRQQGGVGPDHQLSSTHQTKYFYSQPFQEELDRLFGSEAGYKKHYNKTTTFDANGQASVTYIDQEGRTIATALSGDAPSNLQGLTDASGNLLSTSAADTLTVDLLAKDSASAVNSDADDNIISTDGRTLSTNTQLTVVDQQTYKFGYSLVGTKFSALCMPSGFCYNCAYDLTIEVRDQCGLVMSPFPVSEFVGSFDTACANAVGSFSQQPNDLNVVLSPGVYTVTKTLTVNDSVMELSWNNYLTQSTCVRSEQSFIDSAIANVDTSGCDMQCASCLDAEFISACEASYQMMLSDVSPNGQYAEYLVSGSPAPTQYPLSVLNDNNAANALPMPYSNWRHPRSMDSLFNPRVDSVHYFEADDITISRIPLVVIDSVNYVFNPPVQNTTAAHTNLVSVNGVWSVEPQYLDDVNDFISFWNTTSWAKSLVVYHPEYIYYKWCSGNTIGQGTGADTLSSDELDSLMLATTTLSAAQALGLDNPLGIGVTSSHTPNQSNCIDPYFRAAGLGTAQYNSLAQPDACEYSLNFQGSNLNIWKLAKVTNSCGTIYGAAPAIDNCLLAVLGVGVLPTDQRQFLTTDADWITFRSLYFSIKQHFQLEMQEDTARYWNDYNGCIGVQQFNPYQAGMYGPALQVSSWPMNDNYDTLRRNPCGYTYPLYINKVKRYQNENDLAPNMAAAWAGNPNAVINAQVTQAAYSNYLATGQCPNALQLQHLLIALNDSANLKATNDSLFHYSAFTPSLYQSMVSSSSFAYVKWSGSGSGATLTGAISGTGLSCSNSITLTFPAGSFVWSGYNSTWRIDGFSQLVATGTYSFTVVATIDDDMNTATPSVTAVLTGSSGCVDVSCSFPTTCEPTNETQELVNLMNMLAVDSVFYTTSAPGDTLTSGPFSYYFNNTQLRNRFGSGNYYWIKVSPLVFKIYDGTANNYPMLEVVFSAMPANVHHFDSLSIATGDTATLKAHTASTSTSIQMYCRWHHIVNGVQIDNTMLAMGNCGPPTPAACVGDEYQRRDDLQAFLNQLAADSLLKSQGAGGSSLDISGVFTSLLEAPLGYDSYNWLGGVTGNTLTGIIKNNTTASTACTVSMTFTATPGSGNSWSKVKRITGIWADESNMFNGVAYDFIGNAWFIDGTSMSITGTSCYAIRNCNVCVANAGNKYENYDQASSSTGSSLTYTASCPATNYYSITLNDSTLCNDTMVTGLDHTQPGTGKYFFTKYSSNGPQTIWQRTTSVTAYTPYNFSVWYMDASKAANTHVTLELWVNSTQLSNVVVTDNAGVWKKLEGTYNGRATAGTDTLKIKTSGGGGVNTQLGIDDIGFYTSGCAPSVILTNSPFYPYSDSCARHLLNIAEANGHSQYDRYIDSTQADFKAKYIAKCMGSAVETFTVEYILREYHYTLYYYDQGSNLVRTVPPAGVNIINLATSGTTIINDRSARTANPATAKTYFTTHTLATTYTYNTLNQLVEQVTPDGDTTRFWYDKLGRIVASQNAKQAELVASKRRYSYTTYDSQGRITEVGELLTTNNLRTQTLATQQAWLNDYNYPDLLDGGAVSLSNYRFQVTKTYYDATAFSSAASKFVTGTQDNLRKRVASAAIYELYNGTTASYSSASHYSYDLHGNVKELVQEDSTLRGLDDVANSRYQSYKKFRYFYDLVSGKVNELWYENGQADAFYYKYEYDADNRVTAAYTSNDYRIWDRDAKYFYYIHGPLARTEIGQDKVQGTDNAYTLHGWIKGVNSNALTAVKDMGRDAHTGLNTYIPVDQYGYKLTYYDTLTSQDYTSITTNTAFASQSGSSLAAAAPNLWNGNIMNMVTSIARFMPNGRPQARAFRYDQLNRIKQSLTDTNYVVASNTWGTNGNVTKWKENFTYDPNGNILTLIRHGYSPTAMDSLNYHYTSGTNKLTYVDDGVSSGNYGDDIDDQAANNYIYDKIGNLVADVSEQIDTIKWNVYGKIEKVIRTSTSTKSDLEFHYNPMGERICKIVKPRDGISLLNQDAWTYTYYVRDASGNVVATYDRNISTPAATYNDVYTLKENHLYGSSRVGVRTVTETQASVVYTYVSTANNIYNGTFSSGSSTAARTNAFMHEMTRKGYELANHLGNVLVTVSDARTANFTGLVVTGYNAVVMSATDYYAFGAPMEGRSYQSTNYRYGFNGQEKDDEVNGSTGTSYTAEFWQYDARLGRRWNTDPICKPSISSYSVFGGSPIQMMDPKGNDWYLGTNGQYEFHPDVKDQATAAAHSPGSKYSGPKMSFIFSDGSYSNFRDDGSIFFSNESFAYSHMWTNSLANGTGFDSKENAAIITPNGVLVLPNWYNSSGHSGTPSSADNYGYTMSGTDQTNMVVTKGGENWRMLALIHTHPHWEGDKDAGIGLSNADLWATKAYKGVPVIAILPNGADIESAAWYVGSGGYTYLMEHGLGGISKDDLIKGATKLIPLITELNKKAPKAPAPKPK